MENRCFVEARQLGHVLDFIEFGWIHLLYVVFKYHRALAGLGKLHLHLIAALAFDAGCDESLKSEKNKMKLDQNRRIVLYVRGENIAQQVLSLNLI